MGKGSVLAEFSQVGREGSPLKNPGMLGKMTDSWAEANQVEDELGTSCARKQESAPPK